jgi:hypothetical protein
MASASMGASLMGSAATAKTKSASSASLMDTAKRESNLDIARRVFLAAPESMKKLGSRHPRWRHT